LPFAINCRSRTGTGKTLAFGIPAITRLHKLGAGKINPLTGRKAPPGRLPSMIVLCPTRELARQVAEELRSVAKPLNMEVMEIYGGVSYDPQARQLRNGVDVVVGTPGRTIDHIDKGNLNLAEINIAVLDEADEMLNMGFADDVERVLDGAGSINEEKPQVLLFSATTPEWVNEIANQYQQNALKIDSTKNEKGARTATTVRHLAIQLPPNNRNNDRATMLEDIIAVEISKDQVEEELVNATAKVPGA